MKRKTGIVLLLIEVAVIVALLALITQLQIRKEFGIYLENNELVISNEDVVWYNRTSHEIRLTEEGVRKIEALKVPLQGLPFSLMIDGVRVYNGSFCTPISSFALPSSEVVIETFIQNNTLKIQMGYPASEIQGVDPRNNSKMLDYFREVGKLLQ